MKISPPRPAFTIVEVTLAFGILAVFLLMTAQLGVWSVRQRQQHEARQTALELAHNVLEAARALPFESLTPEWAVAQKLPAESEYFLPEGKLAVRVETEKSQARRVTVEVSWQWEASEGPRQVRLVTLLAQRALDAKGGTP